MDPYYNAMQFTSLGIMNYFSGRSLELAALMKLYW